MDENCRGRPRKYEHIGCLARDWNLRLPKYELPRLLPELNCTAKVLISLCDVGLLLEKQACVILKRKIRPIAYKFKFHCNQSIGKHFMVVYLM
jgi:hypothetical protein